MPWFDEGREPYKADGQTDCVDYNNIESHPRGGTIREFFPDFGIGEAPADFTAKPCGGVLKCSYRTYRRAIHSPHKKSDYDPEDGDADSSRQCRRDNLRLWCDFRHGVDPASDEEISDARRKEYDGQENSDGSYLFHGFNQNQPG